MRYYYYLLFILGIALTACADESSDTRSTIWSIPAGEVFDGGPGQDGIPSIDDPQFTSIDNINFMDDDDLIVGVIHNGQAKGYPHPILDWHEIVNDDFGGDYYALTYCPLTGTAISWDRNLNGEVTTFGVSGKLYNTNLIPFDRRTESYWSQMRNDCVNGDLINTEINTFPIIETTWATWKKLYPDSQVMTTETGFSRDYTLFPYGDYRTNHTNIIFPVSRFDNRLPAKERVLTVFSDTISRAYSINLFEEDRVIEDNINGTDIIIMGSKADNYIVAYERGSLENPQPTSDLYPFIAEDVNGNRISIHGTTTGGSLGISLLKPLDAYMGYFFAFGAFNEDLEIYE